MNKLYFRLILIFSLLACNLANGQNQWNFWYFGNNAGLNFNSGGPVPALGGQFAGTEGGATISDAATGNLLFYTDGRLVWNRNHVQMPNGFGLMGGTVQSSQSSLIVPKPGSTTLYYIFTADQDGTGNGIRYSIVDMTLAAGLGDVIAISKNTLMYSPASEQQCCVKKANGTDYWIISHEINTNTFRAYTLSAAGVSATYVGSSLGISITSGGNQIGYCQPNHSGTKLAKASRYNNCVELFDFNNATGTVSNAMTITGVSYSYGVQFSIDDTRLYCHSSNPTQVYQYDANAANAAALNASRVSLGTSTTWTGPMQLGKDCRIYLSEYMVGSLAVINLPNVAGTGCNYVNNSIPLGGPTGQLSLPNYNYDFNPCQIVTAAFTENSPCVGDSTHFTNGSTSHIASSRWFFGDPPSGANDSSHLWNSAHLYNTAGTYNVTLIVVDSSGNIDTVVNQVVIHPSPHVNLGNDTTLCAGNTLTLDAGNPGATYLWSTGATTETITVSTTGTYWVNVNYTVCADTDTIAVTFNPLPVVNLGNDTNLCNGQTILLDAGNAGALYTWSTGATTQTISPVTTGTFWVIADLAGCRDTDTVALTFHVVPIVNLGHDTSLCGTTYTLDAGNLGDTYSWSTGATTQTITVATTGNYWVIVSNSICSDTDTVAVTFVAPPIVNLGNDITVCIGQQVTLDAGNPTAIFLWSTGETTQIIHPTVNGTYSVTASIGLCVDQDTINVSFTPLPVVSLGQDIHLCTGQTITLNAGNNGANYAWSTGANTQTITVTSAGTYTVVVNVGSCQNTDTIVVTYSAMPTVNLGPDISLCNGQTDTLNAGNTGYAFWWSDGSTNQKLVVGQSGIYVVRVTNQGCSAYDTVQVHISPRIELGLGPDTMICPGDQLTIAATPGFSSYHWSPVGSTKHYIIVYEPGSYNVTVSDIYGCTASGTKIVLDFCQPIMFVPNAFTPNGNGTNDYFTAYCEGVLDFHMYIFDRWGELVFETTDISQGWDGSVNGSPAKQDVFVYRIDYKIMDYTDVHKYTKYGTVNLIR